MFNQDKIKFVNWLRFKIIKYCSRRRIDVNIKKIYFSKFALHFEKLTIFGKEKNAIIEINTLIFYISIWRSLFSFSLTGKVELHDIKINWNVVSEKVFNFGFFELSFKLRSLSKILLNIQIENILIIGLIKKTKQKIEFYIDLPEITLNDILSIGRDYFCYFFLKTVESNNKLRISACFKRYLVSNELPFFNARLDCDNFTLNSRNSNGLALINKDFLLEALCKKRGGNYQSLYVKFSETPPALVNAIICTEDPNFWNHSGIDLFFIGYALNENIQSKRITRGASTIAMQLTRNLFLNHDKTLIRKVEEMILSFLLENYFKIDKKTILELYLNVIEFAPQIYGIKAACMFYFNKGVSELTLTEILVMTYIIPRPKHFVDALLSDSEQLKFNLSKHIDKYSRLMLNKELITIEDYKNIYKKILFSNNLGMLNL